MSNSNGNNARANFNLSLQDINSTPIIASSSAGCVERTTNVKLEKRSDSFDIATHPVVKSELNKSTIDGGKSNAQVAVHDQAMITTIAIGILVALLGLCAILLIVLQVFVRPIIWAILTSAFLFSSKRYLTDLARAHLSKIEKNGATLSLELIWLPVRVVDSSVEFVWSFFKARYRHLAILVLTITLFHLASAFHDQIFSLLLYLFDMIKILMNFLCYFELNWKITLSLGACYMIAVVFYWNENYTTLFQLMSVPVWLSLLFLISSLMGSYRQLFMFAFVLLAIIGSYQYVSSYALKWISALLKIELGELHAGEPLVSLKPEHSSTYSHELIDETTLDEARSRSNSASSETSTVHVLNTSGTFLRSALINVYQVASSYLSKRYGQSESAPSACFQEASPNIKYNSDKYFILLFWLFICVKLRYDLYVAIPIMVIMWRLAKVILSFIFELIMKSESVMQHVVRMQSWMQSRRCVLVPRPFAFLLKLFVEGDHKMNNILQQFMDKMITLFLLIASVLFVLTASILLAMQVQSETVELIAIISDIVNENVYSKPEFAQLLPEKEKITRLYQLSMNNLYLYGREWMTSYLRRSSTLNSSDYTIIESHILDQWDSLYAFLMRKTSNFSFANISSATTGVNLTSVLHHLNGSNNSSFKISNFTNETLYTNLSNISVAAKASIAVPEKSFAGSSSSASNSRSISTQTSDAELDKENKAKYFGRLWKLKSSISMMNGDSFDYKHLILILKDNLDVLMQIIDSLYLIIKGNVNLLVTILYAVVSTLFSSGFALMNFLFSFIVYMTALFYLLSMRGSRFKPLDWLTEISVFKTSTGIYRSQLLSKAIEESIRNVFLASFKMAAFYGIYTYLIHSLFSVSIVYLPSIVAALFGFLPLLGTYWAALPGLLELWLIKNNPIQAILFILTHLLPTYMVDNAIYSEIKGGHPYLTGLAFAGGVYCFGLEGAILGPLVLCLLIVIWKMLVNDQSSSATNISLIRKTHLTSKIASNEN
jgi:predicted PurR-regulated permease PerM